MYDKGMQLDCRNSLSSSLEGIYGVHLFFKLKKVLFPYIWLCWILIAVWAFSSSEGCSLVVVRGLFTVVASLDAEYGLEDAWTSVVAGPGLQITVLRVVAHRLSCFAACGILLDQGSNLCLLHWQADSLPLSHQGSLIFKLLYDLVLL